MNLPPATPENIPAPEIDDQDPFYDELLKSSEDLYGPDAEFTWMKESAILTMTLPQAIAICGPMMRAVGLEKALPTLEKWHKLTIRISANVDLLKRSRDAGKIVFEQALEKKEKLKEANNGE